jgi:uncharacterized protein (DUF433 family)
VVNGGLRRSARSYSQPCDDAGRSYAAGVARDALLERIVIDPQVCFGKPVIRGTRIWVGLILGLLADGMTHDELLADYPQLTEEDLRACLGYGALLASGRFIDVA